MWITGGCNLAPTIMATVQTVDLAAPRVVKETLLFGIALIQFLVNRSKTHMGSGRRASGSMVIAVAQMLSVVQLQRHTTVQMLPVSHMTHVSVQQFCVELLIGYLATSNFAMILSTAGTGAV